MAVKLGNGNWAVKENKLLAYNDNSGRFFNKEFDFSRGSSATYVGKDGLIKTSDLQSTNLVQNGNFSELGSELIVNGDFSTDTNWSKEAGWTISEGSLNASATTNQAYQLNTGIVTNKTYKVTYTISNYVSGSVRIELGSFNVSVGSERSANGTYTEYIVALGNDAVLFDGVNSFTGSIDNVSVKEVDPNDNWTLGTGWSIGDNKAVCDGSDGVNMFQNGVIENLKKYKISFSILNYVSGFLNGRIGSANSNDFTVSSDGNYSFNIISDGTNLIFRSSSFNGSITNISVKEIKTNTPRIDFSDSTKGALLLEGQSTNLINQSESFLAGWSKINGVVVSATKVTSPDGTLNASQLIYDGTNNGRIERAISGLTQGADYTVSVYARVSSGTQVVRFGSFNDFEYTLTTEWQRLTKTQPENDTVAYPRLRCDDAATIEIYAFQLEQQSYATSYIPSLSGSTTTRLADVCNNSGSAQDFNSEEGVLYAEIAALADDVTNRRISISNGTTSNVVTIELYPVPNLIVVRLISNSVQQAFLVAGNINKKNYNKIAIKYKENDCALWVNGTEVSVDTSAASPVGLSELAFDNGGGGDKFYGKVKDLQVFTTALTDEQLAALTTI